MNKTILIAVKNKIANNITPDVLYVCGNSDYTCVFTFDEEWNAFDNKTARFVTQQNTYVDVVFSGDTCSVPIIENTFVIRVGVYAGNLHTTTPAFVVAKKSILCGTGSPADPPDDVYMQIMDLLNGLNSDIGTAVAEYLKDHPIEGTTFETDETLTLADGILSVNTADVVEEDNTLPVTSAAVNTTVGNINALLATI